MPNKMERFTQRARRVLSLAQEEAEHRHHRLIDTEHMLLGLYRENGGVAHRVLESLGLTYEHLDKVMQALNPSNPPGNIPQLDLSPGAKKCLELSVDEARRMGHHYIGTEHLLLGLVQQSEGVAIETLKRLAVSPEEVRRMTRRILQEPPESPAQIKNPQITEITNTIIQAAKDISAQFQHGAVGPEQLLLGMLQSDNPGAALLHETGIDALHVEAQLRQKRTTPAQPLPNGEFSQEGMNVIERAAIELRYLQRTQITAEAILFGLLQQPESMALDILRELGVNTDDLRRRVYKLIKTGGSGGNEADSEKAPDDDHSNPPPTN